MSDKRVYKPQYKVNKPIFVDKITRLQCNFDAALHVYI